MAVNSKAPADIINTDITSAGTLPARYYRDQRYFDLAKDQVFTRSWQWLTDTDHLKVPGQAIPFNMLEGYLNEPIIVSRDTEDKINCISNVCSHRGALLLEGECHATQLRCRYHGRRFALDGRFVSTPGFEEAKDFPSERDNLPKLALAQWDKFVFGGIKPAFGFDEFIDDVRKRTDWMDFSKFRLDSTRSRDYLVHANWALYVDNYLEGFHVPYVHPSLAVLLDVKQYKTEIQKYSNLQIGVASKKEDAFELPKESPDYGLDIAAYYYWLFPNLMLNFYPWGLSVNIVIPQAPDRTRVRFLTYVSDETRMGSYSVSDIDQTQREDESVVELVQKGIQSRLYDRGRYSPQWEEGVHHFHTLLTGFLGD